MTSPTPAEHTARPKSRSIAAIRKLVDDFFSPWGSWKTAWWEMEVGDSEPFSPDALLREIHKRLDGPDWERLYLRDMEAIADLVGKPDMSRLYDVLAAAVNERPMLLSRIRELEEALLLADHALDYYASTFSGRTDLAAHSAVRSALQPEQETAK
jgi:hypothetical protein